MSNRLAIDPSEIRLSDPREIRRRILSASRIKSDDAPPVVKHVDVDFGFDTPVEPKKSAALVSVEVVRAKQREIATRLAREEIERRKEALVKEWVAKFPDLITGPSPRSILTDIVRKHGVRLGDVIGLSRQRRHVAARQEAMFEIRKNFPALSSAHIGLFIGRRDATTVRHGIEAFARQNGLPVPRSAHSDPFAAYRGLAPVVRS